MERIDLTAAECRGSEALFQAAIDALFPDGYCDCRCGAEHHRLSDNGVGTLALQCTHHRKLCLEVRVSPQGRRAVELSVEHGKEIRESR